MMSEYVEKAGATYFNTFSSLDPTLNGRISYIIILIKIHLTRRFYVLQKKGKDMTR